MKTRQFWSQHRCQQPGLNPGQSWGQCISPPAMASAAPTPGPLHQVSSALTFPFPFLCLAPSSGLHVGSPVAEAVFLTLEIQQHLSENPCENTWVPANRSCSFLSSYI